MADAIIKIADKLLDDLQKYPRSYLTVHLAPLLPQHDDIWEKVLPRIQTVLDDWAKGYLELIEELGVALRPGWTPRRLQMALQAMLDGFLVRYRLQPDDYPTSRWEGAGIFADTAVAFLLGIIDEQRTGESARAALDRYLGGGPATTG